jgi:hypothetical protein
MWTWSRRLEKRKVKIPSKGKEKKEEVFGRIDYPEWLKRELRCNKTEKWESGETRKWGIPQ